MAGHKPKYYSKQEGFFGEFFPEEFTPPQQTGPVQEPDDLDNFLDEIHRIHQPHRLRTSVPFWDRQNTEDRPKIRDRIRDLKARGIIPTESEKKIRLRMVGTPTISLILEKLGVEQQVEECGFTPEIIAKIHKETSKLNIIAKVEDLQLACDYFLWLKRKQKK